MIESKKIVCLENTACSPRVKKSPNFVLAFKNKDIFGFYFVYKIVMRMLGILTSWQTQNSNVQNTGRTLNQP